MEFIPLIIGLFFTIGWTIGVMTQQQYATVPNRNIVLWWWISIATVFLDGLSYWHLLWLMPLSLLINGFAAIAFGGVLGLLIGGIPVYLIIFFN